MSSLSNVVFGPVRLALPSVDAAIVWRRALLGLKAADLGDPVERHLSLAAWSATAAAALSAETDAEGNPQTWGDAARGKTPASLVKDPHPGAVATAGLRELGAGYSDLVALGDEIAAWLTAQIIAPVEAGEKTAGFFARRKDG